MELTIILSAIIIGLLTGYILQRGRGCSNTAFRNLFLIGNNEMALMLVVVVCVELIGYYILSLGIFGFNFIENPIPLSYLLIPLGGFIFGLGTVVAGGCAGGVCYRVGEGSVSSLLSLIGFASGIAIIAVTPLNGIVNNTRNSTLLLINGKTPSLSQIMPRWVWTLIALSLLIYIIYYYNKKENENKLKLVHLLKSWSPIKTGILLGIVGIFARYFSTLSGREFGFSTTDGIGQIFQSIVLFKAIGWAGIFILALIIGSAISASLINEIKITIPNKTTVLRFYLGGILLGVGAMIGSGCNFGHIFGGMPELGISSFVAVIFMLLGNGFASHLYYNTMNVQYPISTPQ